jgi:transcriptional regulator
MAKSDVLQGTLTLLVLKTLESGPLHGYAITQRILERSSEFLRVEEGSLYPALHRMEQDGWVRAEWGMTATNRRARFYELTAEGRSHLEAEKQNWFQFAAAVGQVLTA